MYFSTSRFSTVHSSDKFSNLKFYRNEIPSTPRGDYIENIHKNWWGDYHLLEMHHGYIQWLFPEEMGVNFHATPLRKEEAELMKNDPVIRKRIYTSFQLMLDFWGIELEATDGDPISPEGRIFLKRTQDYRKRYDNWMGGHNNLRVTRCIKSLGRLGMEHLQSTFVEFLMHEIMDGKLRGCSSSMDSFWISSVVNTNERKRLKTIWNNWNKDKKRIFPQIQWKHSASCHDFSKEDGPKNNDSKSNNKLDKVGYTTDSISTDTICSTDTPDSKDASNRKYIYSGKHKEPIVVSDRIPFTPLETVDDSIFEPSSKRRRTGPSPSKTEDL